MKYNMFDAPVPGQSLTDTPQNYPWEHPPRHTNINEAAESMFERLTEEDTAMNMLAMLKSGVPVEAIVRTLIFAGFTEGKFNPDLGLLLAPILMAMIIGIAKKANLKEIVVTLDDKSPTKVAEEFLVRKKFDQVISNLKVQGKGEEKPKEEVEETPKRMGLMTREIEGEE
tara:strand:- start:3772 stop:4281 length:510 start_codon:yes stop_codon:yes gene_type:complete